MTGTGPQLIGANSQIRTPSLDLLHPEGMRQVRGVGERSPERRGAQVLRLDGQLRIHTDQPHFGAAELPDFFALARVLAEQDHVPAGRGGGVATFWTRESPWTLLSTSITIRPRVPRPGHAV